MMKFMGVIFFIIGCYGVYWVGGKSFNRRNEAGIEEFQSYGKAVGSKAIESIVKFASWLFVMFGFLMFCMGWGFGN